MLAFGVLTYNILTGDTPFRSAFDLHLYVQYTVLEATVGSGSVIREEG